LLGFKAQRYSGPRGTQSRSQAALVAFEFEGGSWRLAHVGRWRDEDSGVWPAWEPRIVFHDTPWPQSVIDFDHPPTKREARRFMRDTEWGPQPDLYSHVLRYVMQTNEWQSTFGFVP
jgi:hypothetical protein